MRKIVKCENGHFYDENKYARCPYCNTLHKDKFFINERLESYMPIAEKWNFDSILGQGRFSTVNNPVPVSLLSGDRKPQIRFLGVLPQLSVIIVISHVPQLCFKQLPATPSIHCTFYHF